MDECSVEVYTLGMCEAGGKHILARACYVLISLIMYCLDRPYHVLPGQANLVPG